MAAGKQLSKEELVTIYPSDITHISLCSAVWLLSV